MDDATRRRVFARLKQAVGTETATILMEGWPMDAAVLATKDDLRWLQRELQHEFRAELRDTEHRLERKIHESVTGVKTELGERMHKLEVDLGERMHRQTKTLFIGIPGLLGGFAVGLRLMDALL